MIKFSIPGYYQHSNLVLFFAYLQKEHPEVFIENRCIDSTYDLPAGLIWNGGRGNVKFLMNPSDIWMLADEYHGLGIHLRHTCTNCLLEPKHFSDFLCNEWLKYNEYNGESVIINSDELGRYINKEYPKYSLIWSTTRSDNHIDTVNSLSQKNMVVLDYQYNNNTEYLQALHHPENIEILCAEYCVPNCPNRQEHYIEISKQQLWLPYQELSCPKADKNIPFYQSLLLPHAISNEYIDELYSSYNIQNFKISGRMASPIPVIEAICYYLIQPEYEAIIRQDAVGAL